MKPLDEMIQVMTHFKNGGRVQWQLPTEENEWEDVRKPTWDWDAYTYRIHPDEYFLDIPRPRMVKKKFYRPVILTNGGYLSGNQQWSLLPGYQIGYGESFLRFEEREEEVAE